MGQSIFKLIIIILLIVQALWDEGSENLLHVGSFFGLAGGNFKGGVVEGTVELLVADEGKDQGQDGKWNEKWCIDELLHPKVTEHGNLVQYESRNYAHIDVRPQPSVAFVCWNIHFESLLWKDETVRL